MDKIYIIEDDENIRNLLKIALEGFGYEAEGFETAEEGLERIKEEVPSLAIFDWMLPGMDGVTAIRKIRQTDGLQELPIMLLTAKEKELDKVVGLDCGADDYMVKPFGVLELSARIRSLLRRAKREVRPDVLAAGIVRRVHVGDKAEGLSALLPRGGGQGGIDIAMLIYMGIGKTKLFQLLNEDLGQIKLAQRAGVGAAGRVRGRVDFYIF